MMKQLQETAHAVCCKCVLFLDQCFLLDIYKAAAVLLGIGLTHRDVVLDNLGLLAKPIYVYMHMWK